MSQLHPPGQLHGVAEDEAARGMDQRRRLGDRLDDAGLVVCALQRQQRSPGPAAGGLEPVEIDASVGARAARSRAARKPMPGKHAGMLARADDQPIERRRASPAAEKRIERRVRGLRAARIRK